MEANFTRAYRGMFSPRPAGYGHLDTMPDGWILVALEPEQRFPLPTTMVLNWDVEMKK
jgi:hypothetical protein